MQKSLVKKYFIFFEIQNREISNKNMYGCTTMLPLFTIRNLSFLYFPKYNIFLAQTFLHILLVYISIYIFNAIILRDLNIFKILKVKGALMPMYTESLLLKNI
jgi:hypothetical protein